MPVDKIIETDLLIIGGGLSGLFAAIKARELGVSAAVVEKAFVGKSGGGALGASWFAVFNPEWGHDKKKWIDFITEMGEYLNNRDWVEIILHDSYSRYCDLLEWGIPFAAKEGRTPVPGASHAMPLVKKVFMTMLRDKAVENDVRIFDRIMITDLIKGDGEISGAVGFSTRSGDFFIFRAKATIVCTGSGAFKIPGWTDSFWTADGDAMNYRAGAEIVSKEFGGKDAGVLKDYASARMGLISGYSNFVNAEGDAFFDRYSSFHHTEHRRMMYSVFEVHAGRGPIYADLAKASTDEKERIKAMQIKNKFDWLAERVGFDVDHVGKVEIGYGSWVGNQPSLGGAYVDTQCKTTIHRLFAAGDCAGTRMCGSFYPPMGYGLAGAAVTGARAGQSAAHLALNSKSPSVNHDEVKMLKDNTYTALTRKGGFSPEYVAQILRSNMVPYYIMQVKHAERLRAVLNITSFLKRYIVPKMKANDAHELRMAHEANNMALNAEMILRASLFRKESRGSHYREDYPCRNDDRWLVWTIIRKNKDRMHLFRRPIPKAWRPDPSVPYEKRYEMRFPGET